MRRTRVPVAVVAAVIGLFVAACSSDSGSSSSSPSSDGSATTSSTTRAATPDGPAARNAGALSGGKGLNLAASTPVSVPDGWVEEEFAVEGTATSYRSDAPLPSNGRFDLVEDQSAEYRTRIVVRRPQRAADFNGTAIVEWLNVSGGLDAAPDYSYTQAEIERRGYAWVGVSAQLIGIEGGPVAVSVPAAAEAGAGKGLRTIDPERYGDLHHPGDAFSYDIFTQVARLLRTPDTGGVLGPLRPDRVFAVGESQSAFALVTYVDGVQPLTGVFDGFLVHSRGGAAAPLGEPGKGIDITSTVGGAPTTIRTDGEAPVIVIQTESDVIGVLNAYPARQDDSARFRWWETAGTAHADRFILGATADTLGCPAPVNDGPSRFVTRASLRALDTWVRDGIAAPEAPRLEVNDAATGYARDAFGITVGGIRTPAVDVPVDVLSGESAGGPIVCVLSGSTTPVDPELIRGRFPSSDAYLDEFRAAARRAVGSGFVLDEDREEILATAQPDRIPS